MSDDEVPKLQSASGRPILPGEAAPKMGPLSLEHPLVVNLKASHVQGCPACRQPFAAGEFVTLIALGPGDDPEARARARAGRAYNALGIPVHWACATGEET